MAQTKQELEAWYSSPDPWGYETNPDDLFRKNEILEAIPPDDYHKALDIGCGEGWITQDLPAEEIHGLELSETASERLPKNVKSVTEPEGEYDLVLATGVLYPQYDHQQMLDWILKHATGIVIVAGISDWFVDLEALGTPISRKIFKYREYLQEVRVYDRRIS